MGIFTRKFFLFSVILALFGYFAWTLVHKGPGSGGIESGEPRKIVTQEQLAKYDFSNEELLKKILSHVQRFGAPFMVPGAKGALLHSLARYHVHAGKPENALADLSQIEEIINRAFLVEVYAGIMLEDIAAGRDTQVLERLQNLEPMYAKIEAVRNSDIPQHLRGYRKDWMRNSDHSFCRLAGKAYASKGNLEMLQKVEDLQACQEDVPMLRRYHLDSLLVHSDLARAYRYILTSMPDQTTYRPKGHSFEHVIVRKGHTEPEYATKGYPFEADIAACLPKEDGSKAGSIIRPDVVQDLLAQGESLKSGADDKQLVALSRILIGGRLYEQGEAFADRIGNEDIRRRVLTLLYEHYFLAGDREKTLALAEKTGLFDEKPLEVGGFGRRDPSQWYNVAVPGIRILPEKPDALAYEIASRLKNDRTGFTAFLALFSAFEREKISEVAGCSGEVSSCIISRLEKIAGKEADKGARDFMYAALARLERMRHNPEKARAFTAKISDPRRMVCHYDMCSGLAVGEDPRAQDRQKHCMEKLASVSDKGLSELRGLCPSSEAGMIPGSVFNGRELASSLATARSMLQCHYDTGLYAEFVKEPEKLGDSRNTYLKEISILLRRDGKLEEAMGALAGISVPYERRRAVWDLQGALLSRRPFTDETLKRYLGAIDSIPVLRKEYTMWWNTLNQLLLPDDNPLSMIDTSAEQDAELEKRRAFARKILEDRPDIKESFLKKPPYLVMNMCEFLLDHLPAPESIVTLSGRPKVSNDIVFKTCPMRLVSAGFYKEALYLSDVLFDDPEYNYRTQVAVLSEKLKRENAAYRNSTLNRRDFSFMRNYAFDEDGFVYIKPERARQTYTRADEPHYACSIQRDN